MREREEEHVEGWMLEKEVRISRAVVGVMSGSWGVVS